MNIGFNEVPKIWDVPVMVTGFIDDITFYMIKRRLKYFDFDDMTNMESHKARDLTSLQHCNHDFYLFWQQYHFYNA